MSAELLKELRTQSVNQGKQIEALTKGLQGLTEQMKKQRDPAQPDPSQVIPGHAPRARIGEDVMNSRPYRFSKMLGMLAGHISVDQAKHEAEIARRLDNIYVKEMGAYDYKGIGNTGVNRFLAPLATNFLQEDVVPGEFRREMREMVAAGTDGSYDLPDEMNWWRKRHYKSLGYDQKTLSYLHELTGGALVAPPEQGELIELLRSKEALVNAGAKTVPLPPQGKMKFPRHTAASNTYWVGENSPITDSDIGTGEVTLSAKKLAVLIKTPNELIRFANPATEALIRDDMTKSLALGLDLAGLEGTGSDVQPRGLIFMPDVQELESSQPFADGDALVADDIYRMVAAVEEVNAEFEGFIMRPKTLYRYFRLRTDSVTQGDGAGPYLFSLIREAGEGLKPMLAGYPVTKSTQISQVRSKGANSDLTYVAGGMWSDLLIGMFGAIEFASTALGDTPFRFDQTWVRGILSADIAARHESAFVWMDQLEVVRR